jgi:large subunit ribosomal protein L5
MAEKKEKAQAGETAGKERSDSGSKKTRTRATLRVRYEDEIRTALRERLGLSSPMAVPRLDKIVINMGLGIAVQNPKVIESAVEDLGRITGQRPIVTRARKSVANFKLREGMPIGVAVTLRSDRMYEFLERLIRVALPRVRDFRGVSLGGFDGRGNYTLGLREHSIFPEIDLDKVEQVMGLSVSMVTTAGDDVQGRALLEALGVPFRQRAGEKAEAAAGS